MINLWLQCAVDSNYYENMKTSICLGTLLKNQNSIQEIDNKISTKAGTHVNFEQNTFPSRLLAKYLAIKIHRTVILPVIPFWLWNMVSYIKSETQAKGILKHKPEVGPKLIRMGSGEALQWGTY